MQATTPLYDRAAISVLLKENLTVERSNQIDRLLNLGVTSTLTNKETNEANLAKYDYIYMEVMVNDTIYQIVHGFPNGSPMGIVIKDGQVVELLPGTNNNQSIISLWYAHGDIECICGCSCDLDFNTSDCLGLCKACTSNHRDSHYWFREPEN